MGWAHQSRVEAAAASLESATAAFVAYLDALPDAAAIQPLPGGWTASRHAAHLALTNDVFIGVINGGGPLSASPASPISPTSNGTSMLRPLASRRRRF